MAIWPIEEAFYSQVVSTKCKENGIIQTGNGIIPTGNGTIYLTSRLRMQIAFNPIPYMGGLLNPPHLIGLNVSSKDWNLTLLSGGGGGVPSPRSTQDKIYAVGNRVK